MTIVTFVGAGSVEFTRDLVADLARLQDLGPVELRLHDIDPVRLETAAGLCEQINQRLNGSVRAVSCPSREQALDGADFVVNMVQIGGVAATRKDFEVPRRFGLRQTIADTLGVGGIFRALRTFPFLAELAADISSYCPKALLLNYTNPMAMNVGYLSRVAPAVRTYGLCHSVYWTVVGLAKLLGIPAEDVQFHSAGVNHQAWLLRLESGGRSLYPALDQLIDRDPELRRRVRVDMYRRLGYYPTETSEHSSEYVPWYVGRPSEVDRLRIPLDAYVEISEDNVRTFERTRDLVASGETVPLESTATEYAPQVIHSVVTGTQRTIQVNVPNHGLIPNLPAHAGVEVPATVDRLGLHPWRVAELPPQCAALNRNFLNVCELTIHAALSEDPRAIRQAAMVDPNTAASLSVDQIWGLCDDLVTAHGELLPPWARVRLM